MFGVLPEVTRRPRGERADELPDVGDRIDVYNRAGIKKLSRAAALRPELVPYLNDELEWITLTSADAEP